MKKISLSLVLMLMLITLVGFSETTATTLYDFKNSADKYVISQIGQEYFNKNLKYLGDKPYPEDTPNSNLRIAQYSHKISVGDYNQDVIVTVWFNFKNGNWSIGNNYNTSAEELPNCIADTTKCMPFQTTKERAIEIAKNGGAFDGAEKYTIKIYYFYGNVQAYVWSVTTYKSALNGKTAIIDLNTGNLISMDDWRVLYAKPEYKDAVLLTDTKKLSPYSIIKERIRELQQKMKTNTEQKGEQTEAVKEEMNARKQPLININAVKNAEKVENQGEEKQIREEVREEKKEEIKQKLTENSIKRINAYTERIVNRFYAALERFVILSDRAESRIQKIEEGGILLNDAKTLLQKTREEISLTETKIGEMPLKIDEIVASENPKEMFKDSKEIFKATNESIKAVHKSLVEVIKSIKSAVEKEGDVTKLED